MKHSRRRRRLKRKQPVLGGPNGRRGLLFVGQRNGPRVMLETGNVLLGSPVEGKGRMGRMVGRAADDRAGRRARRGGRRRRDVRAEILMDDVGNFLNRGVAPRRARIPLLHEFRGIRHPGFDEDPRPSEGVEGHGSGGQHERSPSVGVDSAAASSFASPAQLRHGFRVRRDSRRTLSFHAFQLDGFPFVRSLGSGVLHRRRRSVFIVVSSIPFSFPSISFRDPSPFRDFRMRMNGIIDGCRLRIEPSIVSEIGIVGNEVTGTGGVIFVGAEVHLMMGRGRTVVPVQVLDRGRNLMLEVSVVRRLQVLVTDVVGIRRHRLGMLGVRMVIGGRRRHPRRRGGFVSQTVLKFALYHVIVI